MALTELTLAIIKPDAVENFKTGEIIQEIEGVHDFEIVQMVKFRFDDWAAKKFYEIHQEQPFYDDLCIFMSSGPSIVLVLRRENAVQKWRSAMGTTDPAKANPLTIRRFFGESITRNAVHGSDSLENVEKEIEFFQLRAILHH